MHYKQEVELMKYIVLKKRMYSIVLMSMKPLQY